MSWDVKQARTHFHALVDAALERGPQRIEAGGKRRVVVMSEEDFNRLVGQYPTMADLILGFPADPEDLPRRRPSRSSLS